MHVRAVHVRMVEHAYNLIHMFVINFVVTVLRNILAISANVSLKILSEHDII